MPNYLDHGEINARYNQQQNYLNKVKRPIVNYLSGVVDRGRRFINNPAEALYKGYADTMGINLDMTKEEFIAALDRARRGERAPGVDPNSPALQEAMSWIPGPVDNVLAGITVYHGSPHKWDKVDLSKIGTGEGAQAYGHGFYAAESPGVAKSYAENLSIPGNPLKSDPYKKQELIIGDKSFNQNEYSKLTDGLDDSATKEEIVGYYLAMENPGRIPLNYDIRKNLKDIIDQLEFRKNNATKRPDILEDYEVNDLKILKEFYDKDKVSLKYEPHFYELDLPDETIDMMLDWDKPLSEQPKNIQIAVSELIGDQAGMTGKDAYQRAAKLYNGKDKASDALRIKGIPGIKYLDGSSRNSGEGTRNFVVFGEDTIKPLTRNGKNIR